MSELVWRIPMLAIGVCLVVWASRLDPDLMMRTSRRTTNIAAFVIAMAGLLLLVRAQI